MERREIIAAVIILILLGVLGYFVFRGDNAGGPAAVLPATQQYENATYGYSFQYPTDDVINAYSPQYVEIGTQDGSNVDGIAEADVVLSEASSTYTNFDDFAQSQAALDCDASGPGENISCPSVQSSQPFTTQTGVSGEEFYFNEMTADSSGSSTAATFGPFFAFDISGNTTQENAQFSALIIRPLLSSTSTDPSIIEGIANSLQLQSVT